MGEWAISWYEWTIRWGTMTNYKSAENVWDILLGRMPEKSDWMQQSAEVLQKLIELLLMQSGEAVIAQKDEILNTANTALNLRSQIARASPIPLSTIVILLWPMCRLATFSWP